MSEQTTETDALRKALAEELRPLIGAHADVAANDLAASGRFALLSTPPASGSAGRVSLPALIKVVRERMARAWDEGFDAGERDVFNHEQAGWKSDDPCIDNPYRDVTTPPATTDGGAS